MRVSYYQSVMFPLYADGFYVTWGASEGAVMTPGQSLPPHGKQLGRLDSADLKQVIQKVHNEELLTGTVQFSFLLLSYNIEILLTC